MTPEQLASFASDVHKAAAKHGIDRETLRVILADDQCRDAWWDLLNPNAEPKTLVRFAEAVQRFDADPARGRLPGRLFTEA
jgi:hypothetical protein